MNVQKYYLLEGDRVQAALNRLKDPRDLLMGLVRESELFLEAPISLGKRFCDTEMLTRTDNLYCWWVPIRIKSFQQPSHRFFAAPSMG